MARLTQNNDGLYTLTVTADELASIEAGRAVEYEDMPGRTRRAATRNLAGRSELGMIFETRREDGSVVRQWAEPWSSSLNGEWLDKLADQQMWDYEREGKTATFLVLACGDLPLSALMTADPEGEEAPEPTLNENDDPEMGTIDADAYRRVASRAEQHERYIDSGPAGWDDDGRP